jgi:hypothetical protein
MAKKLSTDKIRSISKAIDKLNWGKYSKEYKWITPDWNKKIIKQLRKKLRKGA